MQYAIVRGDLAPGHAAAQAGHAFLASYLKSPPASRAAYPACTAEATKIVLTAPDARALLRIFNAATKAGLPSVLWVEPEEMDGASAVMAVGIGPADRKACKPFTKGLRPM